MYGSILFDIQQECLVWFRTIKYVRHCSHIDPHPIFQSYQTASNLIPQRSIYKCSRKNVYFPIHCHPSPACRRATPSCQRSECNVANTGWPFSERPIAFQCCRGRGRKHWKIVEKRPTIFSEHPEANIFIFFVKHLSNWFNAHDTN